jgi:hypothetical protein
VIQVGPFTLEGPGAQQELDPPEGQVFGVQLINQGLWVLQATTGGGGSFVPAGWCQTILTAPGSPLTVKMDPAAGPVSQTTLYANWLQQGDQPPPAGPFTQIPPAPAFLDYVPATELLTSVQLTPSPLAWGIVIFTDNADFGVEVTNQSLLDPLSLTLPTVAIGGNMYYVPFFTIEAFAGPSVVVVTWGSGHGNGSIFYEVDATQEVALLGGGGSTNATQIQGIDVTTAAPSGTQVLLYNPGTGTIVWGNQTSGAPGTTVESYITAAVPLTANTPTAITSVTLGAGTWLISAQIQLSGYGSNNTLWIGPNGASTTGAYQGKSSVDGTMSLQKSVTLTATTTVYLNFQSSSAFSVEPNTTVFSGLNTPNSSGITAVQTA